MQIRITTLSENTVSRVGLLAEHGLSILVETDRLNILLDTGLSISASYNADTLGVDLSKIDKIVLSHGHHDHTGGLQQVLRKMKKKIEVFAHPDMWTNKYARREGQDARYCGIPFRRQELENLGALFNLTTEPVKINNNIMTTGEIPMVTDFEHIASNLYVKKNSTFIPDKLLDDQALIIKTERGLAILLGCAHRGIINTIYHAQQLTGVKQIATVIGGCHLVGATEEQVLLTINALKELEVQSIGVSHCTSLPAAVMIAHEFGDKFFFNNAGTRIDLD
ncbi:MBL fold metallo-hydrolase [Chloroflexota bacterium]